MKWREWADEDNPLDLIQVTKNCPASWARMHGNDEVRHCTHCDRNVYNLSNMSRRDALRLVQETEGRMCVRFYRRPDGRMMTRDCGWAVRARVRTASLIGGFLAFLGLSSFILSPVYAGAAMSPRGQLKFLLKRIKALDQEIAAETDRERRAGLKQIRERLLENASSVVERLE